MKYLTLILTLIAIPITPYAYSDHLAKTDQNQLLTVRVIQFDKKDIRKYCMAGGGACYQLIGDVHIIYIPQLKGELDYVAHQKLGHELHHALGMKHF